MNDAMQPVPSLIVPTQGEPLLLPCAVVAEIVDYTAATPQPGAPLWLMGFAPWRDLTIPVVSFEAVLGAPAVTVAETAKLVVLNILREQSPVGFYGLVAAGSPRLVQINEKNLTRREDSDQSEDFLLHEVLIRGDPARVPDLVALESMLLGYLSGREAPAAV